MKDRCAPNFLEPESQKRGPEWVGTWWEPHAPLHLLSKCRLWVPFAWEIFSRLVRLVRTSSTGRLVVVYEKYDSSLDMQTAFGVGGRSSSAGGTYVGSRTDRGVNGERAAVCGDRLFVLFNPRHRFCVSLFSYTTCTSPQPLLKLRYRLTCLLNMLSTTPKVRKDRSSKPIPRLLPLVILGVCWFKQTIRGDKGL